jgi:hypothetical protein
MRSPLRTTPTYPAVAAEPQLLVAPDDAAADERLPAPPEPSRAVDFRAVTWNNILENDEGKAIGVMGMTWDLISSKQLRTVCSQLAVRGVKNAKKQEMVDRLCRIHAIKKVNASSSAVQHQQDNSTLFRKSRKEIQCSFRLINILFSDSFADELVTLGNATIRHLLDSRGGARYDEEPFWVRVHGAFLEPHPDYDELDFVLEDDVIMSHSHINPGKIVQHDWKRLRFIWNGIKADYKAALARYRSVSGGGTTNHDQSFYNACNGKLEIYYLWKKLEQKPNLNGAAEVGDLPTADEGARTTRGGANAAANAPNTEIIANAIRDFGVFMVQSEMAKQMVSFLTGEGIRREQEESRRRNEEIRRQEDHEQSRRKVKFDEWEKIQTNLRTLRAVLRNQGLDEEERRDLKTDCSALKKRKHELAIEMGFDDK